MPAWKVLVIGLLACVCLALALATVVAGGLLTHFMRYASGSLDAKPVRARR
jgi:hypothetical protein